MPSLPGWVPLPLRKIRILMKMRLILLQNLPPLGTKQGQNLNWKASCAFISMFGLWQAAWAMLPPTSAEELGLNHGWVHWSLPFPGAILQMPCLGSCLATSPSVILAHCPRVKNTPVVYGIWASLVAQLVKKIRLQRRRPRFHSWVGKIRWRRDRLPAPVSLGFPCGSAAEVPRKMEYAESVTSPFHTPPLWLEALPAHTCWQSP